MIFGKLVFEVESDFIFKKSSKQSAIKSMEKAVLGAKNFNGFGNDFSNDDRAIINSRIKIISQSTFADEDAERLLNDHVDILLNEIFFEVKSKR